jgi:hypothetical protein
MTRPLGQAVPGARVARDEKRQSIVLGELEPHDLAQQRAKQPLHDGARHVAVDVRNLFERGVHFAAWFFFGWLLVFKDQSLVFKIAAWPFKISRFSQGSFPISRVI